MISQTPDKGTDLQPGKTVTIVSLEGRLSSDAERRRHGAGTRRSRSSGASASVDRRDRAGRRRLSGSVPGAGERHHRPRRATSSHIYRGVRVGAHTLRSRPAPRSRSHARPVRRSSSSSSRTPERGRAPAWRPLRRSAPSGARPRSVRYSSTHLPGEHRVAEPESLSSPSELCRRSVAACGVLEAGAVRRAFGGGVARARSPTRSIGPRPVLQAVLLESRRTRPSTAGRAHGGHERARSPRRWPRRGRCSDAVDDDRLGLVTRHLSPLRDRLRARRARGRRGACSRSSGARARRSAPPDPHESTRSSSAAPSATGTRSWARSGIGLEGFRAIVAQPEVRELAVVVETPPRRTPPPRAGDDPLARRLRRAATYRCPMDPATAIVSDRDPRRLEEQVRVRRRDRPDLPRSDAVHGDQVPRRLRVHRRHASG